MFFRIVTTRYKNKEYSYLKLLESYRSGNKIKQRVLINIVNLDRIPRQTAKMLTEELHDNLEFCNSLRYFSTTGARFSKLSYIFALEKAFKTVKGCSESEIREIYLNEKNKTRYYSRDREQFYNLIHNKVINTDNTPEAVFWSKKLNQILSSADNNLFLGVLLNTRGLPLRYVIFRRQNPNALGDILAELKAVYRLNRIIPLICEETYQCFIADQLSNRDTRNPTPEVFLHRQSTNWLGQTNFVTERYFILNCFNHGNDEISQIIQLINEFADYLGRCTERVQNLLTDSSLSAGDILDITIISHLLYKLIILTLNKNNLTLSGSKTKFLYLIPGRVKLHTKEKTL